MRRPGPITMATLLIIVLAACSVPVPIQSPSATPTAIPSNAPSDAPSDESTESVAETPPVDATDLRFSCGGLPFASDLLTGPPGTDEQAADPAAAALRAHLSSGGAEVDFLPATGWYLVAKDGPVAEYIALDDRGGVVSVSLELQGSTWHVTGWGQCQPRAVLGPGLGPAEWAFDPAQPRPDASTQVFDALVTELSCNSGQPADGRIVGPEIIRTADQVLVIFAVRPRPGAHDCPSNPSTRVRVDLGEPVGERALLDGGRFPPGDPSEPTV